MIRPENVEDVRHFAAPSRWGVSQSALPEPRARNMSFQRMRLPGPPPGQNPASDNDVTKATGERCLLTLMLSTRNTRTSTVRAAATPASSMTDIPTTYTMVTRTHPMTATTTSTRSRISPTPTTSTPMSQAAATTLSSTATTLTTTTTDTTMPPMGTTTTSTR